jgi:hypothetical protein
MTREKDIKVQNGKRKEEKRHGLGYKDIEEIFSSRN